MKLQAVRPCKQRKRCRENMMTLVAPAETRCKLQVESHSEASISRHSLGESHLSYSLNSLKGGYIGDYIGDYYRGY